CEVRGVRRAAGRARADRLLPDNPATLGPGCQLMPGCYEPAETAPAVSPDLDSLYARCLMPFVEAAFVVALTAPAAGLGGKLPSIWEAFGHPAQSLDRAQQTFQAAVDRS